MRTTAINCRVTISRHLSAKTKGRICFKIKGYCRFRLHAFVINLSLVKRNTSANICLRKLTNDGNKLPRYYIPTSFHKKNEHLKRCSFFWRKLRDSNPCAFWANGFQDRLVMTTSISFRLYKVDSNFLIDSIYYILNKNKNQMIKAVFHTFLSIAVFCNFANSFNELVF